MHHVSVSSMEGEAAVLEVLFTALMDVGTEGRRSVLSPPSSSSWARVVVFGTERLANLLARTSSTASSTQVPAQYGGGGSSSGSSCEGVGRARFLVEGNSRPASWSPSACETSVLGLESRAISSRRRCSVSSASASRSRSRSLGLEVGEDGEEDGEGEGEDRKAERSNLGSVLTLGSAGAAPVFWGSAAGAVVSASGPASFKALWALLSRALISISSFLPSAHPSSGPSSASNSSTVLLLSSFCSSGMSSGVPSFFSAFSV